MFLFWLSSNPQLPSSLLHEVPDKFHIFLQSESGPYLANKTYLAMKCEKNVAITKALSYG